MKPWNPILGLPAVLLLVTLAGCSTVPAPAPDRAAAGPVWPPPPNEARIAFVGCWRGPRDIGETPSAWRSFGRWLTGDTGESLDLQKPFAVAVDETGNLCLTDTEARLVAYADLAHKKWRTYSGSGKVKFASPVAVARRAGIFYVADSELGAVFAFDTAGRPVFEIHAPLLRPVGLTLAGNRLAVVDAQANAVFVFDLAGRYQYQFGRRGDGPGEFNFPTCIAADGSGHLLVSDTMNCRVETFDLTGRFCSQFGSSGDTSGHFSRPKGVATDTAGHVYVVDALFDNFQIFDPAGNLLLNVGEHGSGPGGLGLPHGIAISANNRIYVADALNHRVQIFQYLAGHE